MKEAYELIRDDGVDWLAGRNGEGRVIKSVNVIEIPDCFEWIRGGEMMLTTLYPYKTIQEKIDLIIHLNKGNAACVLIHPGNEKSLKVPDYLIDLSDNYDFPLLAIDRKVPYSVIIKKIYEALLNREELALKKAHEVNLLMNQVIISKGGVYEILKRLSHILSESVILLDESFDVIEAVYKNQDGEYIQNNIGLIRNYFKEYIKENLKPSNSANNKLNYFKLKNNIILAFSVLNLNDDIDNYLLISMKENIIEYEDKMYSVGLLSATTAIKIERLKNLAVLETEQKLKLDFFDDIISNACASDEVLKKRARTLGLKFADKNYVLIFDMDDFEGYYNKNYDKGEEHIQKIKKDLKKAIRKGISEISDQVVLFVPKSDGWVLLLGFSKRAHSTEQIYRKTIDDIVFKVIDEFSQKNHKITLSVGISSSIERINELKRAYDEAVSAKNLGNRLFGRGKVTYNDDLGIFRLISIPQEKEEILRDKLLNRIYEYDKKRNGNLIETLEVFLDTGRSIKTTAKKLFTHPNTVKYRLKRIKEIAGEEVLENEQKRLYYHILVKVLRMVS
ncbi:MAG: PucR family transcriptional regulator [Tepidanaerobacteraceae bacterium]